MVLGKNKYASEYFEIAYAGAANRLCFFTGTGFSKAVSDDAAPSWQGLLERICDEHISGGDLKNSLFPPSGKNPLHLDEAAQVISAYLSNIGKSIHTEVASIIDGVGLSGDYTEIEKFFSSSSFRVVTTNYDKLSEKLAGEKCQSLSPGRPIPRSSASVKVYHVHGSVDVPQKMVVTADDYFNFMHRESYFSRKLSTIFHENTVIIIGYSLGDTNLKSIVNEYRGFMRAHSVGSSIFIVSRNKISKEISEYYSNCYGIRVIDDTDVNEFFYNLNSNIDEEKKIT